MGLYHFYHCTISSSLFRQQTDSVLLARCSRLNNARPAKVLEPVNITLYGKAFADVINLRLLSWRYFLGLSS